MGVRRFSKKNYSVDIQLEMDLFVQKWRSRHAIWVRYSSV